MCGAEGIDLRDKIQAGHHGRDSHMDIPLGMVLYIVQPCGDGLKIVYDGGGQLYQFDAVVRQFSLLAAFLKQRNAQFLFQVVNGLAQCWLRKIEICRRAGKAAILGDLQELQKSANIHGLLPVMFIMSCRWPTGTTRPSKPSPHLLYLKWKGCATEKFCGAPFRGEKGKEKKA